MADARIVALAKEIKTAIEAGTYEQSYTAHRRYAPQWEVKELGEAKVTISAHDQTTSEALVRGKVQKDTTIDVAVQRIVDPDDETSVDPLVLFAEQIADAVRQTAYTGWTWISPIQSQFNPEHLRQNGVFTTLHTFTFRTTHA